MDKNLLFTSPGYIDVDHFISYEAIDLGPSRVEIAGGFIKSINPLSEHEKYNRNIHDSITLIPLLADAHIHLAISDGISLSPDFHTSERIDEQLAEYLSCGVGHVLSLGTDQRWIQTFCEERQQIPARGFAMPYSAGCGFGALDGWPPELTLPELRFRPTDSITGETQVQVLAGRGIRIVKLWVDDLNGTVPKLDAAVAEAIIEKAHSFGMRVAAHVYSLQDAITLVKARIDALAHSVRDIPVTTELTETMLEKGTRLIPTLVREENAIQFSSHKNLYFKDDLFIRCAGNRMNELRSIQKQDDVKRASLEKTFDLACTNLVTLAKAGVGICMGTDTGFQLKLPGFSQIREMELMSQCGLSAATVLKSTLDMNYDWFANKASRIRPGDSADFMIVKGNPLDSISTLRQIVSVWQQGEKVINYE